MLKSSYKLVTVWGIPIKAHITLLLLILVVAARSQSLFSALLMAAAFVFITLHELGHSYVAIRKGCQVREILLLPIGGVAQMTSIPRKPWDEFLMAIAGPAVSLSLFLILFPIGFLHPFTVMIVQLESGPFAVDAFHILGTLNLSWALFNLIPAFPMDGGRVLRALLSRRIGRLRATFTAATIGKVVAVIFGLIGVNGRDPVLVAIGILIYVLAGREYRAVELQEKAEALGFGFFSQFGRSTTDASKTDSDEVVIGPPPYEQGPDSKASVHQLHKQQQNQWQKMFESSRRKG